MVSDITEHSVTLRQLEQFFKLSVDGLCIVGFDGYIQIVSNGFASMLGYSEQELYSMKLEDIAHPDDLPSLNSAFVAMIFSEEPVKTLEIRCLTGHGEYKWLSWSKVPFMQDRRVYAIARDITEKRHQEEALSHLVAIIEHAEYAILSMDMNFILQSANVAAERLFSLENHELVGHSLLDIRMTPEQHLEHVIDHCQKRGIPCTRDFVLSHSNGTTLDVHMTFSPMWDRAGNARGISLFARDISRQKTWEREMVRLDRLDITGQLAASIGHEVRNPMTTVRGFLQLFMKKPELQRYSSQMNLLIEELDRANRIITEFLTLAQNKPSRKSPRNLNEIIKSLSPLIESDALLGDIEVEYVLEEMLPVDLNECEIRQLILNLVRNALEAMRLSGRKLTIQTMCEAETTCLVVRDEGPGIPPELHDKIIMPFFTTKDSGTGLGLPVCYNIVRNHGARMTFETGPTGTTFTVFFEGVERRSKTNSAYSGAERRQKDPYFVPRE